jgi:3-hydroxyisobutyrate dehydrogenase-like beta-hydroxyacid dehydrogenase
VSAIKTIGLLGAGDMGGAVGRTLAEGGFAVISDLSSRSAETQARAAKAGIADVGSLDAVMAKADAVMSIMPPASALDAAKDAAAAMARADNRPIYMDLNAISPKTMTAIADVITGAGAKVMDGGIIGRSPDLGVPRVYLSGSEAEAVAPTLVRPDMKVIALGPDIGQASTLKMLFASLTKGAWAMMAAVGMAAERYNLLPALMNELEGNNQHAYTGMQNWVGFLAADAHRFGPEMDEIAETLEGAGLTPKFHEGAAWVYDLLKDTPLAAETRATWDRSRPVQDSLNVYLETLDKRG